MLYIALIIMAIVTYGLFKEGLHTAMVMCVNVVLAGLIAFNFYEPLADAVENLLRPSFLGGFEDFLALTLLYVVSLTVLRVLTNSVSNTVVEFPGHVQQIGGAVFGALAGYLVAGVLICILQTLPWHEHFLGFEPRSGTNSGLAAVFPPDRVWLAMMRHAGAGPLAWKTVKDDAESPFDRNLTFDRQGSFEQRYLRYRRYGDSRPPLKYQGELDSELDLK